MSKEANRGMRLTSHGRRRAKKITKEDYELSDTACRVLEEARRTPRKRYRNLDELD